MRFACGCLCTKGGANSEMPRNFNRINAQVLWLHRLWMFLIFFKNVRPKGGSRSVGGYRVAAEAIAIR